MRLSTTIGNIQYFIIIITKLIWTITRRDIMNHDEISLLMPKFGNKFCRIYFRCHFRNTIWSFRNDQPANQHRIQLWWNHFKWFDLWKFDIEYVNRVIFCFIWRSIKCHFYLMLHWWLRQFFLFVYWRFN